MNLDSIFLLLMTLTFGVRDVAVAVESHFDSYTYYTTVSQSTCVNYRTRSSCWSFLIWGGCSYKYGTQCYTTYTTQLQTGMKCQTGWTSSLCNVPICTPSCTGGKVCMAPNSCQCVTTGGECQTVPCDSNNNCYPGTCVTGTSTCSCPPGFSGQNCINIDKTPDISSCQIKLLSGNTSSLPRTATCELPGISPRNTIWIGRDSISQIQATWTTNYVQPLSLPSASHVKNAPVTIGVAETGLSVSSGSNPASVYTEYPISNGPQPTVNGQISKPFADYGIYVAHNLTLLMSISSKLGGQKEGTKDQSISGSDFDPQPFIGASISRSALFQFDLMPPTHCLASNPPGQCPIFPIYLDNDITATATIQPKFYNWTDQGSGISNFHVEVYFMQPNVNNLLVNAQGAVATDDVDPNENNFVFTCTASGVYSIELTVQDQAGNSAKARKLLIYNKDSKLTIYPENPVYIREADPNTGYNWITKFDDPRNGGYIMLTLMWTGHFSSNTRFDGSLGLAAQPWNGGIDDRFQNQYGRRSIYAITNMPNGIGAYGVAYVMDQTSGGRGLVPKDWVSLNATVSSYALPITSLPDGSSIVIWLQCSDFGGATETVKLIVNVDRTAPEIKDTKFTADGIDESTSSMSITTSDKSSGIMQISFAIYDSLIKNMVYSGTSGPKKRPPPPPPNSNRRKKRLVQPCTANDTSCYCIPSGDCFDYIQIVEIDNCQLDRLGGHSFEFRFTVTNGANMTSVQQTVNLGELSLKCRTNVPVAGIVVGCVLGFLLLIALVIIVILLIRVYVCGKPAPRRLRAAGQTVRDKFSSISNHRPQLSENVLYAGPTDIRPNNIDKANEMKPSKGKQNRGKAGKFEEETYVYNNKSSNLDSNDDKIIPSENLSQGEIISEGRFAIIRQGHLTNGGKNTPVATKGLKLGFIDADVQLMEEKNALLSRLPRNIYIPEYFGRLDDDHGSGPVMVLEYCEMSLKDWLNDIDKVNSDVLEEMISFTSNIANGVKFLHENHIIHRRLGVRNVLLKRQSNGLIAKVIGFGPNREDLDGAGTSVPIKWLAPETLQTFHSGSPTYNTKTDAWSFGITAWEIFSKGDAPYPNTSSDKVKDLLMKEKTMILTCPENCSKEYFEKVVMPCWNFNPKKRPEFSKICSNMESYRRGKEETPQGYYTMDSEENRRPRDDAYEQPPDPYFDAA